MSLINVQHPNQAWRFTSASYVGLVSRHPFNMHSSRRKASGTLERGIDTADVPACDSKMIVTKPRHHVTITTASSAL